MKSHRVSRPALEILTYFLRNPAAIDSLEGIAQWRLLEQAILPTISETESALKWLVDEGYLIEIERPLSPRLFQLNPEKNETAGNLLRATRRE